MSEAYREPWEKPGLTVGDRTDAFVKSGMPGASEIYAFAVAVRRDALEEAAGVAEAEFKRWQPSAPHSTVHASAERTAYEIMEQIRTLATSGEEGEQ